MMMASLLMGAVLAVQPVADRPPKILETHFVTIDASDPRAAPIETRRVPYLPNASCFNWVFRVAPEQRSMAFTERFELPAPARDWNSDPEEGVVVGKDRQSAVTTFQASLADGIVTHGWCVSPGDPIGAYRIKVYSGRTLLHQFDFDIVSAGPTV